MPSQDVGVRSLYYNYDYFNFLQLLMLIKNSVDVKHTKKELSCFTHQNAKSKRRDEAQMEY